MLRTRLNDALKVAMKSKEERTVSTVRLIMAALKDRDIAARGKGNMDGIPEDEILGMLQTMIKQRRDSIALYRQGGREELAAQEEAEIGIIKTFMPAQMSEEEMIQAVNKIIEEIGAQNLKDMGRAMAAIKERHAGGMDFTKASALVKERLG